MSPSPAHWSLRHLGRPYDRDRHDCADFVVQVQAREFGRNVELPGRARTRRAQDRQFNASVGDYATPTDTPADGDLVLMRASGRTHDVGRHAGVWCDLPTGPHVLHCTAGAGVCLHPLADLPMRGFEAAGVFKWR